MQKERNWQKNWPFIKNPYFLSDQDDILVILPTHELSTLTKFHCNRAKIVNLLVMDFFGASSDFFAPVSTISISNSDSLPLVSILDMMLTIFRSLSTS